MRSVIFMVGLPGSGKSTISKEIAKKTNGKIVSRDIIRAELGYTSGVDEKAVCTPEQENNVTENEIQTIIDTLGNNQTVIIDDTNLKKKFRGNMIREITSKFPGIKIKAILVETDPEVCIQRRKGQIPAVIIRKMADSYERPTLSEGFSSIEDHTV